MHDSQPAHCSPRGPPTPEQAENEMMMQMKVGDGYDDEACSLGGPPIPPPPAGIVVTNFHLHLMNLMTRHTVPPSHPTPPAAARREFEAPGGPPPAPARAPAGRAPAPWRPLSGRRQSPAGRWQQDRVSRLQLGRSLRGRRRRGGARTAVGRLAAHCAPRQPEPRWRNSPARPRRAEDGWESSGPAWPQALSAPSGTQEAASGEHFPSAPSPPGGCHRTPLPSPTWHTVFLAWRSAAARLALLLERMLGR